MERHARAFAGVEQCAEQQTAAAASRQPQVVLRELPSPKRPLSFHLGADSVLLHSEALRSRGFVEAHGRDADERTAFVY